jgi:hypothetical protein
MGIQSIFISALLVAAQVGATTTNQKYQLQNNPPAKETEGNVIPTFWDR